MLTPFLNDFKAPQGYSKSRLSDIKHTSQPTCPWSSSGEAFNDSCWTSQNPHEIPHEMITTSPQKSSLTPYRHADGLQSTYGGIRAQHLPTVTDVITEISRDPHKILPESLHPNTESLHHPDRLLPVTCQETFAL